DFSGLGGFTDQLRTDEKIDRQLLACRPALFQVALPGQERIGPAAHRVFVAPQPLDTERGGPMVIAEKLHPRFLPVLLPDKTKKHFRDDGVMAVGKYVGLDEDFLADRALDGIAAA